MKKWILVDENDDKEVKLPIDRKTFRGEPVTVVSGTPPWKPSSTGRVYVTGEGMGTSGSEFYPSVVDLKWKEVEA